MSKLINKLRDLGDFHNACNSLDDAKKVFIKRNVAYADHRGQGMTEFARKQPEVVSESLFRVNEKHTLLDGPLQQHEASLESLKTELLRIQALHADIKAKEKNRESIMKQMNSSIAAADKADKRLQAVRVKNVDVEVAKAEADYNTAQRKKTEDTAAFEEVDRQFEEDLRTYKKDVFACVLSSIGRFASQRAQCCQEMARIGEQISEVGSQIPFYDDQQIAAFQTKLQTLRTEPID